MLAITQFFEKKATIYNFDVTTGKVIDKPLVVFDSDVQIYSMEFSDNSDIAWFSGWSSVFGQDLSNLQSSPVVISSPSPEKFGSIQRSANNEIYIARLDVNYISSINNYNDINSASLNENSVSLGETKSRLGLPQLVPLLDATENCIPSIVLTSPETNNSFLHEASNYIETNGSYKVNSNQNIKLKAGNYVEMLPGTEVTENSVFEAYISDCGILRKENKNRIKETQYVFLDSGNDVFDESKVSIFPNPSSDKLNIKLTSLDSKKLRLKVINIKTMKTFLNVSLSPLKTSFDVTKWRKGVYLVEIISKKDDIKVTKRFIKL